MVAHDGFPPSWPASERNLVATVRARLGAPPGTFTFEETIHMLDDIWGAQGDTIGVKVTPVKVPRKSFPGLKDEIKSSDLGTVDADWLEPEGGAAADAPVLVYIHGGGYVIASAEVYKNVAAAFAKRGWKVMNVEYRLSQPAEPFQRFPCGLIDMLSCYKFVLDSGIPASRLFVSGDSAGGGGTLVVGLYTRDHGKETGLPPPAGLIPICPWSDVQAQSGSWHTEKTWCYLEPSGVVGMAALYTGGDAEVMKNPLVSPIYDEFPKDKKLPPMLISLGNEDRIHDEAMAVALKLMRNGHDVVVDDFMEQPHVFQVFVDTPIANRAFDRMTAFAKDVVKGHPRKHGIVTRITAGPEGAEETIKEQQITTDDAKKQLLERMEQAKEDGWGGNAHYEKVLAGH